MPFGKSSNSIFKIVFSPLFEVKYKIQYRISTRGRINIADPPSFGGIIYNLKGAYTESFGISPELMLIRSAIVCHRKRTIAVYGFRLWSRPVQSNVIKKD